MNEQQEERSNGNEGSEEIRPTLVSTVIGNGAQATPASGTRMRIPKTQGSDARPIGITHDMMQFVHLILQAELARNPQEDSPN